MSKGNMVQKVLRIENSAAMTIPKELFRWARKFIAKYRPALEALADK